MFPVFCLTYAEWRRTRNSARPVPELSLGGAQGRSVRFAGRAGAPSSPVRPAHTEQAQR